MTKSKDRLTKDATPISFPRWREVLIAEKLAPTQHFNFEREIFGYLKYLKASRQRASGKCVTLLKLSTCFICMDGV